MPNAEQELLEEVTKLKVDVAKERANPNLSESDREFIEDVYNELNELQNTLILKNLRNAVKKLDAHAAGLKKLADGVVEKTKKLSKVAKRVSDVAKAVGAVSGIVSKAATGGLA